MILLIDNYGSFSWNLYQMAGKTEPDIRMVKNDEVAIEEIRQMRPELVILSPGPGRPEDAGVCLQMVKELGGRVPIFGVDLGFLSICQAYGGKVIPEKNFMHGKASQAKINTGSKLFSGMKDTIQVGRYHSMIVDPASLPACLKVTAATEDREIMAVEHREYPVYGVLFHPESGLTPQGHRLMENLFEHEVLGRRASGKILMKVREMKRESQKE